MSIIGNKLTYISLFSSAGIGCFGFKKQGFECIATSEIIEKRLNIQKFNNKCKLDSGYILGDITNSEISQLIFDEIKKWNKVNNVDVVIATPPCQGMSVANQKKKNELPRNSLVVKAIELIKKINPKVFIFENVFRFLKTICIGIDGKEKLIEKEIENELSSKYLFNSKILNFKNYGSNSSRTRTLVIGVRKDCLNYVCPFELFPDFQEEKTLKDVIFNFKKLKKMDEFDSKNPLHHFKAYDKKIYEWVKDLKEGESAFDNKDIKKIPHRIVNGKIIPYVGGFGDKYKRQEWNKVAPCIHTANDCLASQNTLHPSDNRPFSIAELMELMTIPKTFKWSEIDPLNLKTKKEKIAWIKLNQSNIRKCIGESVPTKIFENIAIKIKNALLSKDIFQDIKRFELKNTKREINAAYYTDKINLSYIYNLLPDATESTELSILEPSVGAGSLLIPLFKKYENIKKVELTIIDIDNKSLEFVKKITSKIAPKNFKINYINSDYLNFFPNKKYDIILGNPPFIKIKNDNYNNLFEAFWNHSLNISKNIIFINPKYLLMSNIYHNLRNKLKNKITNIVDFGEKGFNGVKIETIVIKVSNFKTDKVEVYSITKDILLKQKRNYIFGDDLPFWIIYRNNDFDEVYYKLEKDIFNIYKNYEVSNNILFNKKIKNSIWILRSKNIDTNSYKIIHIDNYDKYANKNEIIKTNFYKQIMFLKKTKKQLFLIPTLTYYPRVIEMPKNTFVNGSVLVASKKKNINITKENLLYFYSNEFRLYYSIAFNHSTRTLNIDSNSIKFFGVIKNE